MQRGEGAAVKEFKVFSRADGKVQAVKQGWSWPGVFLHRSLGVAQPDVTCLGSGWYSPSAWLVRSRSWFCASLGVKQACF